MHASGEAGREARGWVGNLPDKQVGLHPPASLPPCRPAALPPYLLLRTKKEKVDLDRFDRISNQTDTDIDYTKLATSDRFIDQILSDSHTIRPI